MSNNQNLCFLLIYDPFDHLYSDPVFCSLLKLISQSTLDNVDFVVCINQSIDTCVNLVKLLRIHSVEYLCTKRNLLISGGVNFIVSIHPTYTNYILLSTDVFFKSMDCFESSLTSLIQASESNCDYALLHPYSEWEDDDFFNVSRKFSWNLSDNRYRHNRVYNKNILADKPFAITQSLTIPLTFALIKRQPFVSVGMFNADLLGGENIDLSLRLLSMGYKSGRIDSFNITHYRQELRDSGQGTGSATKSLNKHVDEATKFLRFNYGNTVSYYYYHLYTKSTIHKRFLSLFPTLFVRKTFALIYLLTISVRRFLGIWPYKIC